MEICQYRPTSVNTEGMTVKLVLTKKNCYTARFIDSATVAKTLANDGYLDYLATAVGGLFAAMKAASAHNYG